MHYGTHVTYQMGHVITQANGPPRAVSPSTVVHVALMPGDFHWWFRNLKRKTARMMGIILMVHGRQLLNYNRICLIMDKLRY